MTFSILFLLLNIRCVRLIHVVTFSCSLFITIKLYSILWVSHHLFIPSTIYENLDYCNIMTHAAKDILFHVSWSTCTCVSAGRYLGVICWVITYVLTSYSDMNRDTSSILDTNPL